VCKLLFRETIEAILNIVSPGCRSEMEAALETQSQVSDDCKYEIQRALRKVTGASNDFNEPEEMDQPPASKEPPKREGIHPGVWIAVVLLLFFGAAAAYVVYANQILKEAFPEKPEKKLSRQKLEKLKRKGN
jgi:hypothetical protein